jgi:hypothetical protein
MRIIRRFLYNDNMAFGVLLALLTSIITFALLYLASYFFPETFSSRFLRKQVFVLISIFINLLPFRTYMVSLKFEKTGRGILVSMFALMILYFVFVHANENVL